MGTTTPNIGLYIPAAGETLYQDSFAQGMINLDLHDHSGGPNKGVQISSTGLADFSVTYNKLNSNVADPTTGIGTNSTPPYQNQLILLGILKNLYQLAAVPGTGFISMNGSVVAGRVFQNSSTVTWTNPDGIAGNPSAAVNTSGIFPVTVPNGGTGVTSFNPWDIICGGTTSTGNLQQVSGEGTSGQVLTSNGSGTIPSWQAIPSITQNLQIATVTMSASQFNSLSGTPITIVPAQGAGKMIIPYNVVAKLVYGGVDRFHSGSSVRFYYQNSSGFQLPNYFQTGTFLDTASVYYYTVFEDPSLSSGIPLSSFANQPIVISVNSSNFSGGSGNTVTMSMQYTVINI